MKHDNATTQTFRRGDHVRLSGLRYGTYDGEIGRVVGDLAPVKGHPAYAVDMGDVVVAALEADMSAAEPPKDRQIPRWEA